MVESSYRQSRGNAQVLLVAIIFMLTVYAHQRKFNNATSGSRLELLASVVVHKTLTIDTYHKNTPDKAFFKEHYYSDKAPGTALLAFPAFACAVGILGMLGLMLELERGWLVSSWASCAWSQSLPAALGGTALFCWLTRYVGEKVALVTILGIFIGGLPLPYSTMLFSHAQVVGLLGVAVWAIDALPCRARCAASVYQFALLQIKWKREILAGLCVGFALASEYTAGIVCVALSVWQVLLNRRGGIRFFAATIPPLLLIPCYSWACFGNPFILPYSLQASFPEMQEGLYGIKWPNVDIMLKLLFSPTRELLFWTPFLMMAALGYSEMFRRSHCLF
jgi:hypothetical protein